MKISAASTPVTVLVKTKCLERITGARCGNGDVTDHQEKEDSAAPSSSSGLGSLQRLP